MSAGDVVATSKEELLREKRGQGLAARDAVRRDGECFVVSTMSFKRGDAAEHKISRDESGRVRCTCAEYESEVRTNAAFRCEHIYAVKHWQKKVLERQATTTSENEASDGTSKQSDAVEATQSESVRKRQNDTADPDSRHLRVSDIEAQLNHPHAKSSSEDRTEKTDLTESDGRDAVERATTNLASLVEETPRGARHEFPNILRLLRQPIDAKLIRVREGWTDRRGNKHMVEYVEWHTVADMLDRTFPAWSHHVQSITQIGSTVAVVASISIGDVTREGIGTGACDTETGIKKAEHDALKRAAVKFGIARELYQRETEVIETEGGRAVNSRVGNSFEGVDRNHRGERQDGFRGFPQDPRAKGMNDLVTPKQLGMINRSAREVGVNAEKECAQLMNCKLEDLSKRAASSLIDYLKEFPDSANKMQRRAS